MPTQITPTLRELYRPYNVLVVRTAADLTAGLSAAGAVASATLHPVVLGMPGTIVADLTGDDAIPDYVILKGVADGAFILDGDIEYHPLAQVIDVQVTEGHTCVPLET